MFWFWYIIDWSQLYWLKLQLNICIDNSSSKGSSNSSTCNLLSSRTVLIWLELVTCEAFLFKYLHDLILSLFILNYSWRYKIQKPRETRKVMLRLHSYPTKKTLYFNAISTIFQQASYLCLLCVWSSLLSSIMLWWKQLLLKISSYSTPVTPRLYIC